MTGLKAKLAERIAAGKVLVVVGTGVSLASTNGERLASWKGLINNGIEHCAELGLRDATWVTSQKELLEGDLDDLLGVAEQVSRRLGWKPTEPCGGDWNGWLRGTVGGLRARNPELIEAIRDLGVPIATLNYDSLLTEVTGLRPITWQRTERWLPVLQGNDEAILHLHGHWDHPSSVVLGIRSYNAVLGQGLAQHLQRALTSLLSLAFIGCSATLEDPNFSALLTWMREQLSGTEHSHYLLIRENEPLPVDRPLLRQARVVPLPYGREHADLLPFIRDLAPNPPNKSSGASSTRASSSTSQNNIEHESEPKSGGFDPSGEALAPDFSTKPYKEGDLTQPRSLRWAEGEHQEKPISLFYSYSHRDEGLRGELEAHLSFLRRSKLISEWHDRIIGAGEEWKGQIDRQLAAADIILLLVSADFIASDYCWGEEMTKALARHQLGDARVIPVILRPCRWQRTPLGSLQAVPRDGKPVSEWPNHDVAFDQIATAVERTIDNLQQQRRRAGEQAQQQTQEARKRAEAQVRQAIEEQQRNAQWREQDEARRAAEAEAAPSESLRTPVRHVAKLISDLAIFRDIDAPWCPEMVALPLGECLMGSKDEEGHFDDEGPQHGVTIGRRFAIGRYPVTFAEYDHFCDTMKQEKPDHAGWGRGNRPVINVSWRDAAAYCVWLANETGKPYRLPSEAEWEYACRAGTRTRYAFGDAITPKDAKYSEIELGLINRSFSVPQWHELQTSEVGSYPPNAWGLYAMHGNVWEWVEDISQDSYKGAPSDGTAWTNGEGKSSRTRICRGGSWKYSPRFLRSAARDRNLLCNHYSDLGFRVVRMLD